MIPAPLDILVLGGGGREHALCWALKRSPLTRRLFCAPGNAGIAADASCVALDPMNFDAVITFCRAEGIGLVVVGPDNPLAAGAVDALTAAGIRAFGPTQAAAELEWSKGFTKDLCAANGIPTARYARFDNAAAAKAHARRHPLPVVIKADGLALGKGVVIAGSLAEAEAAIEAMFAGSFGQAGRSVVIEEFLAGEEVSFFCLCDGTRALPLGAAQDHKRVGDGDTGPNTGGMGCVSPARVFTPALEHQALSTIVQPTLAAMAAMGRPYRGVLYAGLILTAEGPKLIEYNVRFGDPECQVLMLRLASDPVTLLVAAADGSLAGTDVRLSDQAAVTVVMAANGYPGTPEKGSIIEGLGDAAALPGVTIFHAGTALKDGRIVAHGGRVLNVSATGATVAEARDRAYAAIARIRWPGGFCRSDIAARAVAHETAPAR